jgi:hypothetical protein
MRGLQLLLLLLSIVGALLSSCSSNMPVVSPTGEIIAPATKAATSTFTLAPTSQSPTKLATSARGTSQVLLFDDWPQDGLPTDVAKITAITLEKNTLKIHVVYPGTCQEHSFALHAWTGFLESNPPQGELYLSHNSHDDTCTENVDKLLSFDLTLLDQSRAGRHANPLLLRVYAPTGGSFAKEPFMPLIEWP